MAIEKVIDIKVQGNADEAVGSLRSQLRQAQAEVGELSAKFGATSREAVEAAKRAGELKDQIGDAKALTDAFNPDAKFKALSSSLAGVAGGFAAVQGGMALFGAESKEVEKTLLKVQGAMALSQGLQTIGESVDSFKQLGAVVKSYTIVQRVSTVLQAAFNAVMAANPIGAVVVAVTALVAAGYALINFFRESAQEARNQTKAVDENAKALDRQVKSAERANEVFQKKQQFDLDMAKASGKNKDAIQALELKLVAEKIAYEESARATAKSTVEKNKNYLATLLAADADEELIKKQKETTNKSIEEYNKQNKIVQSAYDERTAIKRKQIVDDLQDNTDQNKKIAEQQYDAYKTRLADELKSEKLSFDEKRKLIKEYNKLTKDDRTEFIKLVQTQEDEAKKKDAEALKSALQAQKDATLANELEITKAIGDAQDKNAEAFMTRSEIEERAVNDKYFRLIELAKQQGKDTLDLEIAQANEINDIRVKTDEEDRKIKEENSAATIELSKKEAAAKVALMDKTAGVLSRGADLLGKNTAAGKAMSIAAATINTYQGITAELATKTVTPFEIGLKIANVALIAATGLKAVKDIVAVKVPGGGGGGAAPSMSGAGAGGGAAPQFNVVGNSGVNQLANVMSTQQQTPVKAYVVPSDVTTGQSLDRNIIRNASLG
jgi:hypothetical protein